MIERDVKTLKVSFVCRLHVGNQFCFRPPLLARSNHDRGTVSIVRTYKHTLFATKLLKSDPNVGLNVLDQMSDMDVPVGIGQGCGYEKFTIVHKDVGKGGSLRRNRNANDTIAGL